MSAVYRHGQKYCMIPRGEEFNPMKLVSCSTVSDYEAVTVTPQQAFAIVEGVDDPLVRTLLILIASTAMRVSEALALAWSDIDWKKCQINIRRAWVHSRFGPPKSKSSKAPVPLHQTVAATLQAWRMETSYAQDDNPLVRVLVIVVAVTAIRIGEALGLMWSDVDWKKLKINIRRDWVDGELGLPKSRASKAPVEMHETLAALLQAWRQQTPYSKDSDFLFPSFKLHGKQPRIGSMIVQDYIRPAAVAAGLIPEDCPRFGFHNLRHGLTTFLIENGHDPVVVRRMLRQSNVDMTMHYTHNSHKARDAQAQFIERFLPNGGIVADVEEPNDEKRVPVRVQ